MMHGSKNNSVGQYFRSKIQFMLRSKVSICLQYSMLCEKKHTSNLNNCPVVAVYGEKKTTV